MTSLSGCVTSGITARFCFPTFCCIVFSLKFSHSKQYTIIHVFSKLMLFMVCGRWRCRDAQVINSRGHRPFGVPDCRVADQESASPVRNLSLITCSCTSVLNTLSLTTCLHGHETNSYDTGDFTNPMEKNTRNRGELLVLQPVGKYSTLYRT